MALSSLLDSEATFCQQADECGLSEPWVTSLKNNGVATFAKLSFAITSPGTVASDDQVTRFMGNLRPGVVATIADLSAFKRIFFESQTLMIHRFKSAAKGDDMTPKRMPAPERDARLALQRQHLRGLDISGPLEPAHSLYDMCAQMVDANLATYEVMKKWVDRMFAVFSQPAAPGFSKVSQAQLLRADRQAFVRLSETFTGSLKVMPMAGKPLDPLIERLENDVSVTYFMSPVPIQSNSSNASDSNKTDKKRQVEVGSEKPQPNKFTKNMEGKGKGENKKREPVPAGLKGMHSRTPQGDQICFGYNLGTCKQGSACPRKHVCAVPGCYKNHPQTEHQ